MARQEGCYSDLEVTHYQWLTKVPQVKKQILHVKLGAGLESPKVLQQTKVDKRPLTFMQV